MLSDMLFDDSPLECAAAILLVTVAIYAIYFGAIALGVLPGLRNTTDVAKEVRDVLKDQSNE